MSPPTEISLSGPYRTAQSPIQKLVPSNEVAFRLPHLLYNGILAEVNKSTLQAFAGKASQFSFDHAGNIYGTISLKSGIISSQEFHARMREADNRKLFDNIAPHNKGVNFIENGKVQFTVQNDDYWEIQNDKALLISEKGIDDYLEKLVENGLEKGILISKRNLNTIFDPINESLQEQYKRSQEFFQRHFQQQREQ